MCGCVGRVRLCNLVVSRVSSSPHSQCSQCSRGLGSRMIGCGALNKGAVVVFYFLVLFDLLILHVASPLLSDVSVVFVFVSLAFIFVYFSCSIDLSCISDQVVVDLT